MTSLLKYKGSGHSSFLLQAAGNPDKAEIIWKQKSSPKETETPK